MSKMILPDLPGYSAEKLIEICKTNKKIQPTHIRRLGRFLQYFENDIDAVDVPDVSIFRTWIVEVEGVKDNFYTAHTYLHSMSRVFRHLYGTSPFHRALDAGILAFWHEIRPPKHKADYKPKMRKFSLLIEDLPAEWRDALADMEAGIDGVESPAPVSSIAETQKRKICELAKVAVDSGYHISITVETAIAYEKSLLEREKLLAKETIKSSLIHIRDFAAYLGAPEIVLGHLRARTRFHERRAAKSPKLKEQKIMKVPSYTAIFEHAFDLLGQAANTGSKRVAQRCRNHAAALVLFCPFPLRVADTQLRFGENVTYDGEQYQLFVPATSKNGEPFHARVASFFGLFIDELVLQGADKAYLEELRHRAIAQKRLLFENHGGEPVFDMYVSYAWRETYGTGSHIARTKIHDELAVYGLAGVEGALRACSHRSERSAEHYRTRAFTMLAADHVHRTAEQGISDTEWNLFFNTDNYPESTP